MRDKQVSIGRAQQIGLVVSTALCLFGSMNKAQADPNCIARILADVPALEASEQVKSKRNGTFGPITHIKVNKKYGKMYYCAEHSYCYDSNAFKIATPCRFKLDKSASGGDYFQYSAL